MLLHSYDLCSDLLTNVAFSSVIDKAYLEHYIVTGMMHWKNVKYPYFYSYK